MVGMLIQKIKVSKLTILRCRTWANAGESVLSLPRRTKLLFQLHPQTGGFARVVARLLNRGPSIGMNFALFLRESLAFLKATLQMSEGFNTRKFPLALTATARPSSEGLVVAILNF